MLGGGRQGPVRRLLRVLAQPIQAQGRAEQAGRVPRADKVGPVAKLAKGMAHCAPVCLRG